MKFRIGSILKVFTYPFLGIRNLFFLFGWKKSIALIIVLFFLFISIGDMIDEQSPMPVLKFTTGVLVGSDNYIGMELDRFLEIAKPDILDIIFFLISISFSVYLIVFWFWIGIEYVHDMFFNQSDSKYKKFVRVFIFYWSLHVIYQLVLMMIEVSNGASFEPSLYNFYLIFFPFPNVVRLVASLPFIAGLVKASGQGGGLLDFLNPTSLAEKEEGRLDWLKGGVRWVVNLPTYFRENISLMKKDLLTFKDWKTS